LADVSLNPPPALLLSGTKICEISAYSP
jgi:hypothetical protein